MPPLVVGRQSKEALWRIDGGNSRLGTRLNPKDRDALTRVNPLLDAPRDTMVKRLSLVRKFRTELGTRNQWSSTSIEQGTVKWYTDGSKTEEGTGVGILGPNIRYHEPMGKSPSIFQAEVYAIERCIQFNLDRKYTRKRIVIMSDSQAAIGALSAYSISSKMVCECRTKLDKLSESNVVTLRWVPGHIGVGGNEEADRLARRGSEETLFGPEPFCGIGMNTIRKELRSEEEREKIKHWNNLPGMRQSKTLLGGYNLGRYRTIIRLDKARLRTLTGFLTGHCRLRKHLRTLGLEEEDDCRLCGEEEETPEHLIVTCLAVVQARREHLGRYCIEVKDIPSLGPLRILGFLREIGLEGTL